MAALPKPVNGQAKEVLDSWKEISFFLNRGVRTVQRWEREEGFPVRRHNHNKRGTVFALTSEIEHWMQKRGGFHNQPKEVCGGAPAPHELTLMERCIAARLRADRARLHLAVVCEQQGRQIDRLIEAAKRILEFQRMEI